MKSIIYLLFIVIGGLSYSAAFANQAPTANENPAYGSSSIQAHLRLDIDKNTDEVHFVRDTNDPKIITKTYILKHADPYCIRPYLREMVQAMRVDYNNNIARSNGDYFNTYSKDNSQKTQKIYVPCGIECIKFADGTGAVIISAEDYRFKGNKNGMSIDDLVKALDKPGIRNSSGQQLYLYFPRFRSAEELQSLVKKVGANMSDDTVELIGGKDKVEIDKDLNCIFFDVALYSKKNIASMLKLYDVPYPQVKLNCAVYEINEENDGMLGLDFQSWKNNDGVHLLQTGALRSRHYNVSDVLQAVLPAGTVNSEYFNFNPKWNTRFLDFLVSKGKAQIVSTGSITAANGVKGKFTRKSGILYAAASKIPSRPGEAEHGNAIEVKSINAKFEFTMDVLPRITQKGTILDIKIDTANMLGYNSDGTVRTDKFSTSQKLMLKNGKNRFYIGGMNKLQQVRDVGGIPILKDIPVLGWLFSTERETLKKTQLVVVVDCERVAPDASITPPDMKIKHGYGFRQWGLDKER